MDFKKQTNSEKKMLCQYARKKDTESSTFCIEKA